MVLVLVLLVMLARWIDGVLALVMWMEMRDEKVNGSSRSSFVEGHRGALYSYIIPQTPLSSFESCALPKQRMLTPWVYSTSYDTTAR